jgi:group I intron endonuclease
MMSDLEERKHCIYMITSPSGKSYIGQTCNYKKRMREHSKPYSGCTAIKDSVNKYGWESFTHRIILSDLTLSQANKYEEFYIKEHNTLVPNGYNLKLGGDNHAMSDDVKRKIGDKNRGVKRTPAQIEANRLRKLGVFNSDETNAKISKALKGKPKSEEHKEKTRQSHIGMKATDEAKLNMRLAQLGRKVSDDTRGKLKSCKLQKSISAELPLYINNIKHLPPDTVFDTCELATLLNLTKAPIGRRIRAGKFPNSYFELPKGGKKYFIPIQDVHNYYNHHITKSPLK